MARPDLLPDKAAVRAEAERLLARFRAAGATPVEADILLQAELLLDLYGEDIRARAYVSDDPLRGEMMLRPDFTVPVVQMHMAGGADPARYCYLGEVFRKQEQANGPFHGGRASEFLQVGYEMFDREDPSGADAEVFALFAGLMEPLGLRAATGDIGILMAAVGGLATTERRRAALLRHIWRPRRFRALLDRFGGKVPLPEPRARMLESFRQQPAGDLIAAAGPLTGLRSDAEIAARIAVLLEDAVTRPISAGEVALIDDILSLRQKSDAALNHLHDFAVDLPAIAPAVERMEARLSAMARRGIAVEQLDFEGSFGRTTLEYYDGFVFGFHVETRPDLPAIASGGRYDALTRVLGQGRSIPAVGGVIRPALTLALQRGAA